MRPRLCVLTLLVVLPSATAAQTSTSDGVQAIVRGDYAAAVGILRPLAERQENPDPLAQFFLASLYKAGLGVTADYFRACGLYLRAAAQPNPLMKQAATMAESIHQYHPVALGACTDASVGVWRQPESATFELDSGHRVRIDQSGVTVEFSGAQTRQRVSLGGANWVFLPTRHTRIDVLQPARHPRHFIEFFMWIPNHVADASEWALIWVAQEVVGNELVPLPGDDSIATIVGPQPPASFRVDDIAGIAVNDRGDAERVVLGDNPRRIAIPEQVAR